MIAIPQMRMLLQLGNNSKTIISNEKFNELRSQTDVNVESWML